MSNAGLIYVVQFDSLSKFDVYNKNSNDVYRCYLNVKLTLTSELQSGTTGKKAMKHLSNGRKTKMMMTSCCVEELASIGNCYLFCSSGPSS